MNNKMSFDLKLIRDIGLLEQCIDHWNNNIQLAKNKQAPDISSRSCALCEMYLKHSCQACPIRMKTGLPTCHGTPYVKIKFLVYVYPGKTTEALCQEEVKFLKDLKAELEKKLEDKKLGKEPTRSWYHYFTRN